jgi:hypothetical protein
LDLDPPKAHAGEIISYYFPLNTLFPNFVHNKERMPPTTAAVAMDCCKAYIA